MVIGTIMIIIPFSLSGLQASAIGDNLFYVVCFAIPGIGLLLLLVGVLLYIPARKRMQIQGIMMADGRTIGPEELNATIPDSIVRERTLLEMGAKEWGFDTWDPHRGTYDQYEWDVLNRYMAAHKGERSRKLSWFFEQGFRPAVMYNYRKMRGSAKGKTSFGLEDWITLSSRLKVIGWLGLVVGILIILAGFQAGTIILAIGIIAMGVGWMMNPAISGGGGGEG